MRKLSVICMVTALILGLTGYGEAQIFRIGAVFPFTGPLASYAEDAKRGIEIAAGEINSAGGINGKRLEVIYEDSMANPSGAVSAVTKLITVDKVPAIVGTLFSSFTLASAPIAERNKTPIIAPMASHSKFSDYRYIFRNTPSAGLQARVMGEYAYKVMGLRKIASLFHTTDTGHAWDAGITQAFEKRGGSVVIHETYPQGSTDFRTALTKIKGTNPQAISLYGTWKEIATQVRQCVELKIEAKILNCSQVEEPKLIDSLGRDADGITYAIQAPPATKASKKALREFLEKFKSTYNKEPGIVAKASYDCTRIVAQAAMRGGETGELIQREMAKTRNFPGIDGELSYDENREPIKKITIKVIKNGKFVQTGFISTGE